LWTIQGGDYTTPPAATNASVTDTPGRWAYWYPTALVQGWVNHSITNDGLLLKETSELTTPPVFCFVSSESANTSAIPVLNVTYTLPPPTPPAGGVPVPTGTPQDGQTLTANTGSWTGDPPITYAYQWQDCPAAGGTCTNIPGATSSTYVPTSSDVGSKIDVIVTATNPGGSTPAASAQTGVVQAVKPSNTGGSNAPTISGTTQDGQTLTASNGTWSGSTPLSYSYQWEDCDITGANCSNIATATDSSYQLTSNDVGHTIRVVVTASNANLAGGGSSSATSAQTSLIGPGSGALGPTVYQTLQTTGETVRSAYGSVLDGLEPTTLPLIMSVKQTYTSTVAPVTVPVLQSAEAALATVGVALQPTLGAAYQTLDSLQSGIQPTLDQTSQALGPQIDAVYSAADSVIPARAATPPQPPTALSYYVYDVTKFTGSGDSAFNIGYNQALSDNRTHRNSLIILDFGGQQANGAGTISTNYGHPVAFKTIDIEAFAATVADAYHHNAHNTVLTIAMGTNNDQAVSTSDGQVWASDVRLVAQSAYNEGWASSVSIWGANDLESTFSDPGPALAWARAYVRSTGSRYLDYGSADCSQTTHDNTVPCGHDCHPSGTCGPNWTQWDDWTLSWGIARTPGARTGAVPSPEIYFASGAAEWEQIALYGDTYQGGHETFEGPLDENRAILSGQTTNDSTQAWDDFEAQLESHSITRQVMPYSLSVRPQS
jgi:hypothetical protein